MRNLAFYSIHIMWRSAFRFAAWIGHSNKMCQPIKGAADTSRVAQRGALWRWLVKPRVSHHRYCTITLIFRTRFTTTHCDKVIVWVRLMNAEQCHSAVDLQTKPVDLGCKSTCQLLSSTLTNRHHRLRHHRLCVYADSLQIGKWQNLTPHRIKTP